MLYRTDDATRWGTGKGANLTPTDIDLNFWGLAERLVAVEGGGASPNSISNITVVGSQMTVYLDDGTALGPYTLPTAMIRYRGDWVAGAAYVELDLVAVPDSGVYLVLRDHTAAATFDANAQDSEGNQLYRWLFPMSGRALDDLSDVSAAAPAGGDVLTWDAVALAWTASAAASGGSSVSDEGVQVLAAPSDINFAGAGVAVTDDGDGTVTVTIGGGSAGALNDLSDVTLAAPAAAEYLRFDGTAWVDAPLAWADIPDKPATFPPSAHNHPSSEISDFAEAVQDAVGAMALGGTNVTVTYDDIAGTLTIDATGASVSDEGAQVLAAPSDINFAGAGVSVADDADGTVTVTIPGGGSTSVSDEGVQVLAGPSDLNFAGAGVSVTDDGDGTVTISISGGGAVALNDLSDVAITTPAAGQFVGYDGAGWVNRAVDWSHLASVPATFPPDAHTHAAADISDFAEGIDDRVAALLVAGTNITLTYDDAAEMLTVASSGGGATDLDGLSDVAITTPAAAQVLQYDGAGWVNSPIAWGEVTEKPAVFPPSAHSHASTEITDFAEAVDDRVAALFVAGANITLTYDDAAGTFTVAASGGGSGTTAAASQWRLYLTGTQSWTNVAEVEFKEHVEGADIATGGTPSASASYSSQTPDKAFDDNMGTYWAVQANSNPVWIAYDFGKAVEVGAFTYALHSGTGNSVGAIALQKNDGAAWVTVQEWTSLTWATGEKKVFEVGKPEATSLKLETNTSTTASSSTYATKGNIYDVKREIVLRSISVPIVGAAGATYKMVVARVSGSTAIIDEIVANTPSQAVATTGTYTFDFPDLSFIAGERFAALLVRTDGTADAVNQVYFPSTVGAASDQLVQFGAARYATLEPLVGDATLFGTGTNVRMTFFYAPAIHEAPKDGQIYARRNASWFAIPAPAGAYQYWRLRLISEDQMVSGTGTRTFLGEIEFRTTAGVTEQATGGAIISSGWSNTSRPFDGIKSGSSNTGADAAEPYLDKYIGYDFGTPKKAVEVALYSANNLAADAPTRFVIEASNDNVSFTEIVRVDPIDPDWGTGFGTVERLLAVPEASGPVDADTIKGVAPSAFILTLLDDSDSDAARTTLGAARDKAPIEDVAGTAYTQVAADAGKWKRTTDGTGITVTVAASVNAANEEITFLQGGAGAIAFAAGTGLTLNARAGALTSAGQFSVCGVKFVSATEAVLFGDIV